MLSAALGVIRHASNLNLSQGEEAGCVRSFTGYDVAIIACELIPELKYSLVCDFPW